MTRKTLKASLVAGPMVSPRTTVSNFSLIPAQSDYSQLYTPTLGSMSPPDQRAFGAAYESTAWPGQRAATAGGQRRRSRHEQPTLSTLRRDRRHQIWPVRCQRSCGHWQLSGGIGRGADGTGWLSSHEAELRLLVAATTGHVSSDWAAARSGPVGEPGERRVSCWLRDPGSESAPGEQIHHDVPGPGCSPRSGRRAGKARRTPD